MHEMSLCEGIVQVLEEQARAQHYRSVKTVWLEIGGLACVEIEALRFGFEVVSKGTLAENAGLEIIRVPGQAYCMDCETKVPLTQRYDPCPHCGGHLLQVTDGTELRIKELEVE
jgi:hydrogenase nickel incorporation protein HypA/HybF